MTDIDPLLNAIALKDETRTGWALRGVADPESVADHSWGTALLCLLFAAEEDVDVDRCLRLAVVHDLAEAETGDLPFRAEEGKQDWDADEKREAERDVMAEFADRFGDDVVEGLWQEYEGRETREARFVKDMDMIDSCLQALVYERDGRYDPDADNPHFDEYDHLDEFFATTEQRLSTGTGERLFADIRERYEAVRDG